MSELGKALPILVGLTGGKGVGKDTVASHLVSIYGFQSVAFADPVRAAAAAAFDVEPYVFTDVHSKETPMSALCGRSPRHVLQTLGTEWGRNMIRSDMWVYLMQHRLVKLRYAGHRRIVISDVRFDDEAEMVRSLGGEVWLVTKPSTIYGANDSHASEKGVRDSLVKRVINNNMDKKTLFTQVGVTLLNAEKDALRGPNNGTAV